MDALRRNAPPTRPRIFAGLLLLGLLATAPRAEAQGSADAGPDSFPSLSELSLEDLGRIEVTTTTQTAIPINRAPATVYSFSAEEIRLRGTRSLLDLVNFQVPGAFVTEDGDELIAAFRGVAVDNNSKVLFLIDGHNTNLQYAKGATPELELGLSEDIERVEVIVGPGSALYGSGATIAVINVITKAPPATGRSGSAYVGLGNGGTFVADAVWRARLGKDWAVTATAGVQRSDGFAKTNASGRDNSPLNTGRYRLNARSSLRLNYGEHTELYARFDRVSRAVWNNTASATKPSPLDTFDYAFLEFRQGVPLADDLLLKLTASYDTYSNSKRDLATGLKIRAVGETHTAAAARLFYTPRPALTLVGGLEYRNDRYGDDWAGENFNFAPTYDPANGTWSDVTPDYAHRMLTPYSRDELGAFAQASFDLSPRLSLVLGGRYDYQETPHLSGEHSATPRVALVFTPQPALTTKLMFTTGFRQPMAILTTPDRFFLGDAGLSTITKPEVVRSLELSTAWLVRPNLSLTVNTFYNRFVNPHSLTTDAATGKLLFTQGGTVDFLGGEFIAQVRPVEKLSLSLAHQFVRLGDKVDDPYNTFRAPTGREIMFYPEDVTKLSCDWHWNRHAALTLAGSLVYDSLGYTPAGTVARTGTYGLVNAGLRFGDPHRRGQWGVDVHNLLNDKTRVPMPATVGRPSDMVPLAGLSVIVSYYRAF
ncbi:MAG TPA: TonB-dependent receptor [Opitutaceae bacterium]|nr:TonB-dependent receptor [Opitutaceae bacterium]